MPARTLLHHSGKYVQFESTRLERHISTNRLVPLHHRWSKHSFWTVPYHRGPSPSNRRVHRQVLMYIHYRTASRPHRRSIAYDQSHNGGTVAERQPNLTASHRRVHRWLLLCNKHYQLCYHLPPLEVKTFRRTSRIYNQIL